MTSWDKGEWGEMMFATRCCVQQRLAKEGQMGMLVARDSDYPAHIKVIKEGTAYVAIYHEDFWSFIEER